MSRHPSNLGLPTPLETTATTVRLSNRRKKLRPNPRLLPNHLRPSFLLPSFPRVILHLSRKRQAPATSNPNNLGLLTPLEMTITRSKITIPGYKVTTLLVPPLPAHITQIFTTTTNRTQTRPMHFPPPIFTQQQFNISLKLKLVCNNCSDTQAMAVILFFLLSRFQESTR